jgi:hypothetical protein
MDMRTTTAVAIAIAGALALPGAAQAQSEHSVVFTDTFDEVICGVPGETTIRGTDVFHETGDDLGFGTGHFSAVFTADDSGKQLRIMSGGQAQDLSVTVDEDAGTITFVTLVRGLPEKVSIAHGPTLTLDAGSVVVTTTFALDPITGEPTGDPLSQSFTGLHGPHPDLVSGFELFCEVVEPYLLDP